MSTYRSLNQTVLAKIEAQQGVDAVPVVGTDAVLVEAPTRNPNLNVVETNEVTGALDDRGPLPAGGFSPFNCSVWLKGAGTGGTAPEFGVLLQGCAMSETLIAAEITGTAVAGAIGSVTVEAADYAGIGIGDVISITAGLGVGQTRVVVAKPGADVLTIYPDWTTAPDVTSTYSVPPQAIYAPTSANLKTLTIYRYRHRSDGGNSKLDKVLGAAGTWTLNMPVRNPGQLTFNFQGQLNEPEDTAHPGAATYGTVRPPPYLAADTYLGGAAIKLNTLTMDFGAEVQMIDNPAQAFGYDAAGVTRRRVAGRFNPPLELQSVRNAFASWRDGTVSKFWVRWGAVAGNKVSIYIPEVLYTGVEEEDVTGFAHEGLPFRSIGSDTGVYISLY